MLHTFVRVLQLRNKVISLMVPLFRGPEGGGFHLGENLYFSGGFPTKSRQGVRFSRGAIVKGVGCPESKVTPLPKGHATWAMFCFNIGMTSLLIQVVLDWA